MSSINGPKLAKFYLNNWETTQSVCEMLRGGLVLTIFSFKVFGQMFFLMINFDLFWMLLIFMSGKLQYIIGIVCRLTLCLSSYYEG